MFRGGLPWWRIFKGTYRASRKGARAIDQAIPGAGFINAWAIVIAIGTGIFLGYGTSVLLGWVGMILGLGMGAGIGWAFNAWMMAGLAEITRAVEKLK